MESVANRLINIARTFGRGWTRSGVLEYGHARDAPERSNRLGILPRLVDFGFLMSAVGGVAILAFVLNRLRRIPYPLWSPA